MSGVKVSGLPAVDKRWAVIGAAIAASMIGFYGSAASGQVNEQPEALVTASRLGEGIAGASVTVITAEQLRASPQRTIPEILALEAGIQTRDLFGSTAGARQTIDMRGFGATGVQNTLILLDGRRLNDIDNGPVDWASIPQESIERIEVIRGNAGAVLYGNGAVGGVINIITHKPKPGTRRVRLGGGVGTNEYYELTALGEHASGPLAVRIDASRIESDGHRTNNDLKQSSFLFDATRRTDNGEAYIQLGFDDQALGLPGGRLVDKNQGINLLESARTGAATPRDRSEQNGIRTFAGLTRELSPGVELAADFGVRIKDLETTTDSQHVDAVLRTYSLTPRLIFERTVLERRTNTTVGVDYFLSDYDQDRSNGLSSPANRRYDVKQQVIAVYGQGTVAVTERTDVTLGARSEWVGVDAGVLVNKAAPGGSFLSPTAALHEWDRKTAFTAGVEHALLDPLTLFGRVGQSVRLPTVDERTSTISGAFGLEPQVSRDAEAGFRVDAGPALWQTSAYAMDIKHELHFNPEGQGCSGGSCFGANSNYDRTRRYGIENSLAAQLSDAVSVRSGVAYTMAQFGAGPFEGKDIPLVADWTASGGVIWQIVPELLRASATVSFVGARRMENDERNFQPKLGSTTVFDLGFSGEWQNLGWSAQVNNLFDEDVIAYAVASGGTRNRYNAYPLPGREFLLRTSMEF
jgi:iron complex outermembrane receptor protein